MVVCELNLGAELSALNVFKASDRHRPRLLRFLRRLADVGSDRPTDTDLDCLGLLRRLAD